MPTVTFLPAGQSIEIPADTSILDAAIEAGVDLDHVCGGNGACTSCHVSIEAGFADLSPIEEREEDKLDTIEAQLRTSRLACQARVRADVTVRIPPRPWE